MKERPDLQIHMDFEKSSEKEIRQMTKEEIEKYKDVFAKYKVGFISPENLGIDNHSQIYIYGKPIEKWDEDYRRLEEGGDPGNPFYKRKAS